MIPHRLSTISAPSHIRGRLTYINIVLCWHCSTITIGIYGVDNAKLIDGLRKVENEIAEANFEWIALNLI